MNSDDPSYQSLLGRVQELESLVANLRPARMGTRGIDEPVFLAIPDGADPTAFKEAAIDPDKKVVAMPDGRHAIAGDPGEALSLPELEGGAQAFFVMRRFAAVDGKIVARHIKIGGSGNDVTVRVGANGIQGGVYDGYRSNDGSPGAGDLTYPVDPDIVIYVLGHINLDDQWLPLEGLEAIGRTVGPDPNSPEKLAVQIDFPAPKRWRLNLASDPPLLEMTYVQTPEEDQWVEMIAVGECEPEEEE